LALIPQQQPLEENTYGSCKEARYEDRKIQSKTEEYYEEKGSRQETDQKEVVA
jgi:hypothetical protein